jgi:hypothetical protein
MNDRRVPGVERPRREPEIIPPDRTHPGPDGSFRASHRVYVARLGPFGMAMAALALGLVGVLVLLLLFGAFLISIPLAVLLIAIAIISGVLRGSPRRDV